MNDQRSIDTSTEPVCWLCDRPSVLEVEARYYCRSCAETTVREVESGDAEDAWPGEVVALRRVLSHLERRPRA